MQKVIDPVVDRIDALIDQALGLRPGDIAAMRSDKTDDPLLSRRVGPRLKP